MLEAQSYAPEAMRGVEIPGAYGGKQMVTAGQEIGERERETEHFL
jgi:hypothetical protein